MNVGFFNIVRRGVPGKEEMFFFLKFPDDEHKMLVMAFRSTEGIECWKRRKCFCFCSSQKTNMRI